MKSVSMPFILLIFEILKLKKKKIPKHPTQIQKRKKEKKVYVK